MADIKKKMGENQRGKLKCWGGGGGEINHEQESNRETIPLKRILTSPKYLRLQGEWNICEIGPKGTEMVSSKSYGQQVYCQR